MLVSQILKSKGDMVFTISPSETVQAATALLLERRVGALVVLDAQDKVVGILSERDVVRVLGESGPDALNRPVSSCMTCDVSFADPSDTIDGLMARMTDRRFRHLPVCKGDSLVGLVSIGDLVKAKIAEAEAEAHDLKAYIAGS